MARERRTDPAVAPSNVRRPNAREYGERRHVQLQRNQRMAQRSGVQKGPITESTRAFTANSGNKTLIKNRLLIREAKCFHLI